MRGHNDDDHVVVERTTGLRAVAVYTALCAVVVVGAMFLAGMADRPSAALPECSRETATLLGPWGSAVVTVEIAETPAEHAQGLMFRDELADGHGMLFVNPRPRPTTFWMKNTLIPLDMLFFAEDGSLRHVHLGAVPHDETPIFGGNDISFTLEIRAGEAARLGLGLDTALRHPAVNQETARSAC